jgi:hypothetical protein
MTERLALPALALIEYFANIIFFYLVRYWDN